MRRNVIFVITNGRSGTNWLCSALQKNLQNWSIHHENPPTLNFNDYNKNSWNRKKNMIKTTLKDGKGYIETNHMYIKTFWKNTITDFSDKLKVIVLYREPELIARSLYSLNTIPGESDNAKTWYFDPKNDNNLFKINPKDDLEKCLWQPYETMARAKKFIQDNPEIPIKEVTLTELNTQKGIDSLLGWIKEETVENALLSTTPTNSKAVNSKTEEERETLLNAILEKKEVMEYEWRKQFAI